MELEEKINFFPSPRATVSPCIVKSLSKPDTIKTHFDDSTQTRFAQFNFQVSQQFSGCCEKTV